MRRWELGVFCVPVKYRLFLMIEKGTEIKNGVLYVNYSTIEIEPWEQHVNWEIWIEKIVKEARYDN